MNRYNITTVLGQSNAPHSVHTSKQNGVVKWRLYVRTTGQLRAKAHFPFVFVPIGFEAVISHFQDLFSSTFQRL